MEHICSMYPLQDISPAGPNEYDIYFTNYLPALGKTKGK